MIDMFIIELMLPNFLLFFKETDLFLLISPNRFFKEGNLLVGKESRV